MQEDNGKKDLIFPVNRGAAAIVVGLTAVVATLAGSVIGLSTPNTVRVQEFHRESDKPSVMRVYNPGLARDQILVYNSETGEYTIPLARHLETISDTGDRGVEEAAIKTLVEWYR
jgi:hypothetical protein